MYEIRPAALKGLGVFARFPIPRGTRIFSERPLLAITEGQRAGDICAASHSLSAEDRKGLLQLSSHATRESSIIRWNQAFWYTVKQAFVQVSWPQFRSIKGHVNLLSIFRSNAFNLGKASGFQQAVFGGISRVNHSCLPNAQGNFHGGLGRFNVHATRDIEVDEEITLNYLREHGAIRSSRQGRLLDGYGFTCDCPACDSTSARGVDGEEKRIEMGRLLGSHAEKGENQGPEKELKVVNAFIELFEWSGIAGRELSSLYFEAVRLNEILGRREDVLRCAEKGLKFDKDCLGLDHESYLESLEMVERIRLRIR